MSTYTPEQLASPDFLRSVNQERLLALWEQPFDGVVYDFDDTIATKGEVNNSILQRQAQLIAEGAILTVSSARGESLHPLYTDKLMAMLEKNTPLEETHMYLTTRNGACTEHAFTREIIDEHPFPEDLYQAFSNHPLVEALQALTPLSHIANTEKLYGKLEQEYGIPRHPSSNNNPALFTDVHRTSGKMYKVNAYFNPQQFEKVYQEKGNIVKEALYVIDYYSGGKHLENAPAMASIIQDRLAEEGIFINPHCFGSDNGIDITIAGVNKGTGYNAIYSVIAKMKEQTNPAIVTLGDSPQHNDAPLLQCGTGVTNVNYFNPQGAIVLDIPGIKDQIDRTMYFFNHVQLLKT